MSEKLQSAGPMDQVHPDADQLTAFAEHALPQHEQEQTLAHLAACADCRQVVFLAQQAVEDEVVAAEPVRARRPWFSGWNPVWPALVAVAGMVAFSVHLRNVAKPAVVDHGTTTAAIVLEQPTVPAAPLLVPPAPAPAPPKPLVQASAKKVAAAAEAKVGKAVFANSPAPEDYVLKRLPSSPLGQAGAAAGTAQLHGAMGGVIAGSAGGAAASAAGKPAAVTLAAPPAVSRNAARSGPAAQQIQNGYGLASNGAMVGEVQQQAMAPPPPMAPAPQLPASRPAAVSAAAALPVPVASANETVTVTAGSALSTDETAADTAMLAERAVVPILLPSHLAAASTATHGTVSLALDANGALFLSKDQGKHWKRVKAQWEGLAAKVGVVQPVAGPPFELMTSAGVIWTSSDGQHWTRK